ncbi:MAG TPA: phospholipase D family protein [Rudaea sp.]|jgi:putative cardiolipin synthase|nr:phospholipase D family protein [Rudaea sp.]
MSATVSNAPAPAACPLEDSLAAQTRAHADESGLVELHDARDSLAARVLLADAATRTLDVQYYIWRNDLSGALLFEAIRRAADRGVRVRLLLDDNNTSGLDPVLAALDSHPRIEIRLFNPFRQRRWRWLGYLTDFSRLNRRMHNKSFTADAQATIVGGRNIGDEYFDAGKQALFVDLDVLGIGPVADAVERDFERYWNSASALPVARVLPAAPEKALADFAVAANARVQGPRAAAYLDSIRRSALVRDLLAGRQSLTWAPTRLVSDDPKKGLARERDTDLMATRLARTLGGMEREVYVISPYFVPTSRGAGFFCSRAREGLHVAVLTNALEATDVLAVHSGYAKRRHKLLRAGVKLYELRRHTPARRRWWRAQGFHGSSASSLHAKTFSVDRQRLFIGSFNFDQRSVRLNTEMGFVIDSAEMATASADEFVQGVVANAYEVRLRGHRLEWVERNEGVEIVHRREPGSTVWQRAFVTVLSWLPIDWLL